MTSRQTTPMYRPVAAKALLAALSFLGITALGGSVEMMLSPGGNQYVRAEWLDGIPFLDSWVIPGLVLGLCFGFGSLVAAYGLLKRPRWPWLDRLTEATGYHWSWSCTRLLGGGLLLWILLEVILIPHRSALEAVYATIGLALLLLPPLPAMRRYLRLA